MKKVIAIILVLILGLSILTACGGREEPPPPLPSPRTRDALAVAATPTPAPTPEVNRVEGFYTIVSLGPDSDEVFELYESIGFDLNDFYIELRSGGIFRMAVFPEDEDDITEGTYSINGTSITMDAEGEAITGTIEDGRITLIEDDIEMVFEKNDSYRGPSFQDAGVDTDGPSMTIPGAGATILVDGATLYSFIPNQTGVWEIITHDSGSGDPYLELMDEFGFMIWEDDDSGGGHDARIIYILEAGTEYLIKARFWSTSYVGSYMLTVMRIDPPQIPSGGGSMQVSEKTIFSFIPDSSGSWEFRTSDNGSSDPYLTLYDENGKWIMDDDDSGGDLNALFTATVEDGVQYYVRVRFWGSGDGSCTVHVTKR